MVVDQDALDALQQKDKNRIANMLNSGNEATIGTLCMGAARDGHVDFLADIIPKTAQKHLDMALLKAIREDRWQAFEMLLPFTDTKIDDCYAFVYAAQENRTEMLARMLENATIPNDKIFELLIVGGRTKNRDSCELLLSLLPEDVFRQKMATPIENAEAKSFIEDTFFARRHSANGRKQITTP